MNIFSKLWKRSKKVVPQTAEEIAKTPSKTIPTVVFWITYLVICLVVKTIMHDQGFSLSMITIAAGLCSMAYMGIEYTDQFIQNARLPSSKGSVKDIDKYASLCYVWDGILIVTTIGYFIFHLEGLPMSEVTSIAGILGVELVAGNKLNKVAVTMDGEKVEDIIQNAQEQDNGDDEN